MILIIDNYDSFSYNLYQMLGSITPDIRVIRNDALSVEEVEALKPQGIVLSPGPGRPENSGICPEVIRVCKDRIPILGICLGHQAICQVFGADVTYAKELMHGKQSIALINTLDPLFRGLKGIVKVGRYHSLAADPDTIPDELTVIGKTMDGEVMAVRHRRYPIYGLQFHPESILTPEGGQMLSNWVGGQTPLRKC